MALSLRKSGGVCSFPLTNILILLLSLAFCEWAVWICVVSISKGTLFWCGNPAFVPHSLCSLCKRRIFVCPVFLPPLFNESKYEQDSYY